MKILFTPWRYRYIAGKTPRDGCFFCAASRDPQNPERLVVHVTDHHLVMLNRHPYTNGHLMVAPREHLATPQLASAEAQREFWPVVLKCQRVLAGVYSPDGFNLGLNLGRTAGAGVPDHFHFHVVPRWQGDTSFISVVGEVRLIPEDLPSSWRKLRRSFERED